jgi:rhomboid family GlyGly-CTERM serine protease
MGSLALTRALLTKFRSERRIQDATGLVIVLAALVLAQSRGGPAGIVLRYERDAVAAGQWWRLLSCHLVHFDFRHLALNVAGLVLLWALYVSDARLRDWLVVALVAACAIGLGLFYFDPAVVWYLGLSGVLHGLWAAGGVACWKRWRLESVVTLALLAAKLVFEQVHGALSHELGATLPVITAAHVYGAIGGLASALALRLWRASL